MLTSKIEYLGGLRTKCTHVKSGKTIETDAPVDNNGKGDNFSPTDLVATAYGSCMLTIVGIYCNQHEIEFTSATIDVQKIMSAGPRRISELVLEIDFSGNNWEESIQKRVKHAAEACPVAKSVDPNMNVQIKYLF